MFGIVGDGPAADAVGAAVGDTPVECGRIDAARVGAVEFAVVVGAAGDEVFERANEAAATGNTPWLAVELGGVGGVALADVDAAVSGFAPQTACYDCLRARVAANDPDTADESQASRGDARFAGAVAGREAATLLSGGESRLLGGVVEVPHAERRLLPVPGCPSCGGDHDRDRALDREHRSVSLDDAISRAERAADDRVGIVQSVGEVESFPAAYYLAETCDTTGFSDAAAASKSAGVAADWNVAFVKALGEALERYSAGVYRESAFTVAEPSALDDCVTPSEFVRPDDWAADSEPVSWVRGEHLLTGTETHLPAEFVQFPPPERRFRPAITTGLGLGNSGVEALLSGLYELIERDATMLSWYSTFEPLGLTVADEAFEELARRARAEGLSVTPLLVTQDIDVPVVAVAVHRDGEWPQFALGSGAALDPTAAARSALAEAIQNWMELRSMGREEAADEEGAIGRYAEFPAEARELVAVDARVPAESVGPTDPPTGAAELDAVAERVAAADVDAYAARVTPRDVASLGFEAVRVLSPQAQPLFTGESYFGERARTVPRDLGFEPRLDRPFHPFP